MSIGALICTANFNDIAMLPAGKISAVQRMVAVFQKIGADMIAVLAGAEDKLLEKHLSQFGVIFLRGAEGEKPDTATKRGLEYLSGKCERIFLLDADRPLVSPNTLSRMLSQQAELVVPVHDDKKGKPVLLSACSAKKLLEQPGAQLDAVHVPVEDDGILLGLAESQQMQERFEQHDEMITRLVLDMSIYRGKQIVDKKLVSLLHFVNETQSVREACTRMQISYSSAWNVLNRAEEELGYALVNRNKGGASGMGTVLTEKGMGLIRAYAEFESLLRENAERLYAQYFHNFG